MSEWGVLLNGVYLSGGDGTQWQEILDSDPCEAHDGAVVGGCLTSAPAGLGLPPLNTEDTSYPQRDGVRHFSDWYEPRILNMEVSVGGDGCGCENSEATRSARAKVREIVKAWSRACDDTELVLFTDCHGEDRADLVNPPVSGGGTEVLRNYVDDPSTADGTTSPWTAFSSTSSTYTTITSVIKDGAPALRIHRNTVAYDFAQLFDGGSVDGWAAQGGSNAPVLDTNRFFFGNASVKFNQGAGTGNYIGQRGVAVSATPTTNQLKENTAYRAYARMWIPAAKTVLTGLRVGGTNVVAAGETTTSLRDQWVVVTHDFTTKTAADGTVLPQMRGGGDTQDMFLDAFWIEEVATTLPANLGTNTTSGLTSRPQNTQVTMSYEVLNPVGSPLTNIQLLARDNPNNDSALIANGNPTSGAQTHVVPADGVWRRIWVTFTIPAGRDLTTIYATTAQGQALGTHFYMRNYMVSDGTLADFFDGDTADSYDDTTGEWHTYEWVGTPYDSSSVHKVQDASYRGSDLNGPFGIPGRPRQAEVIWDGASKTAMVALRWDAVDHRMYVLDGCGTPGSGETCVTLMPFSTSACRDAGRCYTDAGKYCYDNESTTVGADGVVEVLGTECASVTITLNPKLTLPRIQNTTTGEELFYNGTINVGESPVIIDTAKGTATQDGASRTHLLSGDTRMTLPLGSNTLMLLSAGGPGDTGSADVCFRSSVVQA